MRLINQLSNDLSSVHTCRKLRTPRWITGSSSHSMLTTDRLHRRLVGHFDPYIAVVFCIVVFEITVTIYRPDVNRREEQRNPQKSLNRVSSPHCSHFPISETTNQIGRWSYLPKWFASNSMSDALSALRSENMWNNLVPSSIIVLVIEPGEFSLFSRCTSITFSSNQHEWTTSSRCNTVYFLRRWSIFSFFGVLMFFFVLNSLQVKKKIILHCSSSTKKLEVKTKWVEHHEQQQIIPSSLSNKKKKSFLLLHFLFFGVNHR